MINLLISLTLFTGKCVNVPKVGSGAKYTNMPTVGISVSPYQNGMLVISVS